MGKDSIGVVSEGILEQVYLARQGLEGPSFDLFKKQKALRELRKSADRHSVDIEFVESEKGHRIVHRRAKRIALENLRLAYDLFLRNYSEGISNRLIQDTGALILGKGVVPFRTSSSRAVGGGHYINSEKIPGQLESLYEDLSCISTPVEKAVYAHFHIARIHPFEDGNGRLARLVQNGILDNANLPPIVIEREERKQYIDLISKASIEYKQKEGFLKEDQRLFFDFLALKLRDSLKEASRKSC
jgi:hypothetical protein